MEQPFIGPFLSEYKEEQADRKKERRGVCNAHIAWTRKNYESSSY